MMRENPVLVSILAAARGRPFLNAFINFIHAITVAVYVCNEGYADETRLTRNRWKSPRFVPGDA
jgi:hypothetical protein